MGVRVLFVVCVIVGAEAVYLSNEIRIERSLKIWTVVRFVKGCMHTSDCRSMGDAARNIFLVKFFGICKLRDPLSGAPKVQFSPWFSCKRIDKDHIRLSVILCGSMHVT